MSETMMLHNLKELEGLPVSATDGAIGQVKDFYFDDESWVIRYLVVDTSRWLGGREVLISPFSIGHLEWTQLSLPVTVTQAQIRNSPDIDSQRPISRQYEKSYLGYYGYPYYWGGTGLWGGASYPGTLLTGTPESAYDYQGYLKRPSDRDGNSDAHLRSCTTVANYHIRATDGEIGHVQGFLVDDISWSIRYLIVNTSNWWMGHQILLSPEWIADVSWPASTVSIDLNRQAIKDAPTYDPAASLQRDAESAIYSHYGRRAYWSESKSRAVA